MNKKLYLPSTVTPSKSVLDKFHHAFPAQEKCFKTLTDKQFFVYDHAELKRCFVQNDPEGVVHFTVENPSTRPIHLLAVDGCLLSSGDDLRRCDCAIFDESTLCLIEIKTTSGDRQRRKKRIDAEDQLKKSVAFFREKLDLSNETIEAHVCLLDSRTFGPCVRTNSPAQILRFAEMGVALYYGNSKRFA